MIDPGPGARTPISPQLAFRVATLGTVAFALFAVIFFRLWFLQVLSGDEFVAQAQQNRVRKEPTQAPRGDILDRKGNVLVKNRKAIVLELDAAAVPQSERTLAAEFGQQNTTRAKRLTERRRIIRAERERRRTKSRAPRQAIPPVPAEIPIPPIPGELRSRFAKLEKVTGYSSKRLQNITIASLVKAPVKSVELKTDISPAIRDFVVENRADFPGVNARAVYLRSYPFKTLGAQLFGQIGEITTDQIGSERYKGVKRGTRIGQNGLERTYDDFLRGKPGEQRIYVDGQNTPVASREIEGQGGRTLRTTLDIDLQKAGQAAFNDVAGGFRGGFVALNPYTGEIRAMGSAPSFDPNLLTRSLTQAQVDTLYRSEDAPLVNRVTSSIYPTGSTFKIVTAFAGIAAGTLDPNATFNDVGRQNIFPEAPGDTGVRQNAGAEALGSVNLTTSLQKSSDLYYYFQGKYLYNKGPVLQNWAKKLGFGRITGVDTGSEAEGVVPGKAQRAAAVREQEACLKRKEKDPTEVCFGPSVPFLPGDNVNLSIGQGDLQATPMQVALAYAAVANGGRIIQPHLGSRVEDQDGRKVSGFPELDRPARRIKLPEPGLDDIRLGLHAAASEPGGTSTDVFTGWPQGQLPVFGKTGTAQVNGKGDQSWYAAYIPKNGLNKEPLLVVATVEQGGFGAERAAPIACRIFKSWFRPSGNPTCAAGDSATR